MPHDFITVGKNSINITGQRFGRLVALGPVGKTPDAKIKWLCQCDCGNCTTAVAAGLRNGHTRSCGCLYRETAKNMTHGMANDPLHDNWCSIIQRCENPSNRDFANYGGRGITIAEEWRHDFKTFHNYVSQLPDFGEGGRSLDRIDNNLGYSPGNVRWATRAEQNRNRRDNRWITYDDRTQCLSDWAKEFGIGHATLRHRIRRGWSAERALTTPAGE